MTYYESAADTTITKNRAFREFQKHHMTFEDWQDFTAEYGDHEHYEAQDVLSFLGY